MTMRKVTITKLSKPVQSFLSSVRKGKGILVEDATGRAKYGIIPYEEAPKAAQKAALKRLERLQKKVGRMMKRTGKTEAEFDRILQQDT